MGTIPLPALHINPPQQQESPISQIGQLLQLKNAMANAPLQRQELQQNIQAGQLENQQRQQALKDQQAATSAMQEWDGKDINSLAPLMIKKGASAQAVMSLKSKALEMQQTYSKIASDDAATGQKNIETRMKKNDMIGGAFSTVLQAPDDQLPQAIVSTAQQLSEQGLLDPQHLQMAQQIAQQPPAQARTALETMRKGMLADSQLLEQAKNQAQTQEASSRAHEADVNAQKSQMEIASGGTGAMADARFRNIEMNQRLRRPVSAEDAAWAAAYKQQKTLNPVTTFNLQNAGLAGQGGANGQPSALAQSVANGQMKWSDVISPRTPMSVKQQFAAEVHKLNPDFDTSTYAIQTKAAEKATSGQWADTRLAYNTALDHSQLLLQAAKALQNGDVQALNSLKNRFGSEFGSTGPITFNAIANAYNHEVTSVVAKGHMTDKEVETGGASLPSNASLPQIQSVIGAYNSLMKSKRDELDKIIKAGAGKKADGVLNTQSDSQSGGGLSVTAPNGKTYTFKSQADADAFKQKAGIQ